MKNYDRKHTVFFADDEPEIYQVASQVLGGLLCEVVTFSRGEECFSALKEKKCDLLIVDLNMPGMDGMELLKSAKTILPSLPIIMITGYGEVAVAVKAMKAGAYDFVEKPFDEGVFLSVVRAALAQREGCGLEGAMVLTDAEKKVLHLVASGKSNKEMANILACSIRTIENHRYRIMRKMNIESTAGLVKAAIKMGLTD
jgi:two-component system, LuxR family, response regulator FixJ